MRIYFAPLEGITDSIFRRVHHASFGGVEKYFIPFISPTQNLTFTPRELFGIGPQANEGVPAVPQIMAKNAEHFLWAAGALRDMGYSEVNLNLGCPSGTVTAKGKGSGLLRDTDSLCRLLDGIYACPPLPVSIKTRIGFESTEEWPRIMNILASYPIHELTIHPRTRQQFYSGQPHVAAYDQAFDRMSMPIVYNGDLFTADECFDLLKRFPNTHALMLGRGLIANPALAQELTGGEKLTHAALREFHDRLWNAYLERGPVSFALSRMHDTMRHICCCLEDCTKPAKAVHKANTVAAYEEAAARLFDTCPLREVPCFNPKGRETQNYGQMN